MNRVLITGGTGSWGQELIRQLLLLENTVSITVFSRNEYNQVMTQRKFNNRKLSFVIGDVRDSEAVGKVCEDIDVVFHLAALKHVPICEQQPEEAIKTNILGTLNIIKGALQYGVRKVIDVSTDKSCAPNNLYGMTKAVGEKLILNANTRRRTEFVCIRAGNVLGSAGSVVPLFIDQIKKNNRMTVTDKNMTRYFMSLPEAISLVLEAANLKVNGELLVMKMPSCNIYKLAEVMKTVFGQHDTDIQIVGARPGEKVHEMLISESEALNAYEYSNHYYIVSESPLDLSKVSFNYYSSNSQPLLDEEGIRDLLIKGKFL